MNFENQNFLRKLLSTNEYRNLSNISKCLKLISDKKCSLRTAALVCDIQRSTIRRAQAAVKAGRPLQVNGRPKIFSSEEKENIANSIRQDRQEGKSVDYSEVKRIVSPLEYVFTLLIIILTIFCVVIYIFSVNKSGLMLKDEILTLQCQNFPNLTLVIYLQIMAYKCECHDNLSR